MIGELVNEQVALPWSEQTEKLFEHDLTKDFAADNYHIGAKVIADSINSVNNARLITLQLAVPRMILAELNTHCCVTGDTMLEFDTPHTVYNGKRIVGRPISTIKRSIADLYDQWVVGSALGKIGSVRDYDCTDVAPDQTYTVTELYELTGLTKSAIRQACREKELSYTAVYDNVSRHLTYVIRGQDFIEWRVEKSNKSRRCPMQNRIRRMNLRFYNTQTGEVELTHISNIWCNGVKPVYRLTTETGQSIKATADHQIWTNNGWKQLKDIDVLTDKVVELVNATRKEDRSPYNRNDIKNESGESVQTWSKLIKPIIYHKQNGKCLDCGKDLGLYWNIHHVKRVKDYPELAFDEDNVVGLCEDCHMERHTIDRKQRYGYKQAKHYLIAQEVAIQSIEYVGEETVYDLEVTSSEHNFFANRICVHNCMSKNTASSRAIPAKKIRANIMEHMFYPVYWGANKSGMSADQQLTGWRLNLAKALWGTAGYFNVGVHWCLEKLGLHKQTCNRILEPWTNVYTVITSSEWDNFLKLRYSKFAQPEMIMLAKAIHDAIKASTPRKLGPSDYHLPYITQQEAETRSAVDCIKTSVARCCRVSYRSNDSDQLSDFDKDVKLFDKLLSDHHMSPFEHIGFVPHQGKITKELHFDLQRKFRGWYQFRAFVDPETNLKYLSKFYGITLK